MTRLNAIEPYAAAPIRDTKDYETREEMRLCLLPRGMCFGQYEVPKDGWNSEGRLKKVR